MRHDYNQLQDRARWAAAVSCEVRLREAVNDDIVSEIELAATSQENTEYS
jgi:hypothetical protein